MSPAGALAVADWRERVHALYAEVREHLVLDPAAAHRAWVEGRDGLFRDHPASPLLDGHADGLGGLDVPEYDGAWAFEAELQEAPPARFEVPTGTDGVVPFERAGVVRIDGVGSLDVWWLASYGGGLFIPLKDASAGRPGGTYGGGRYLIDTVKGADLGSRDGRIRLDFNFAYNPSCAYDPEWACPLAPAGNTVAVDVPVGERTYVAPTA